MPRGDSPSFDDDPSEFDPETVREELTNAGTSFRKRRRKFFTDASTTPPEENPDDPVADSPFFTEVEGTQAEAVERVHNNRSEVAQRTDESYNAPTTTNAKKWANNPSQFDYPGVDTVNEEYQEERAEEVAQFADSRATCQIVRRVLSLAPIGQRWK